MNTGKLQPANDQASFAAAESYIQRKADSRESSRREILLCLVLLLVVFAAYSPTLRDGFVNYDDPRYLLDNPHLQTGLNAQSFRWAITAFYESNWHPLTWISHAADISVFHFNPVGHHAVNVLLHALNAVLLFLALRRATRRDWESFFVAGLFALHPVNVESVAWVSERKNVFSMFFLLVALCAYTEYARRPSISRYLGVAAAFALGLAAKPQIITLPFLLLLWDFWPLRRWNRPSESVQGIAETAERSAIRLMIEKIPLLALALASAFLTMQAQSRGGAVQVANATEHSIAAYSVGIRMENAVVSYAKYIQNFFLPIGLAPAYPHPGNGISLAAAIVCAIWLLATTGIAIAAQRKRYFLVGWLWFLGTLVPMIGLIQVGAQAMADRYAYLPFIGLSCLVVWGVSESLPAKQEAQRLAAGIAAVCLLAFSLLTYRQTQFWKNSEILWQHTLQVTRRNFIAHDSLAEYYLTQGKLLPACAHFESALEIYPQDMPAQEGLAVCAQARGNDEEAIERYENVIRLAIEPSIRATAFANLGSLYRGQHSYQKALENLSAALQINPDLPIALVGTGLVAEKQWDYASAARYFAHAMHVAPTSIGYLLLSDALRLQGKPDEADRAYDQARKLSSNLKEDQQIADQLAAK